MSALARHLGVAWHTAWTAIETQAKAQVAVPERLAGVRTLGVAEHIWRPSRVGTDRAVTIMVDLTRDQDGCLHARLRRGRRSGTAYNTWLKNQPDGFTATVEQAALDRFRGYANAIRDELPDTVAALDAFHVVRLRTQVVDEVRRRIQQDTLGHRGHKHDPLYQIRGLLRHGVEHLSEPQQANLTRCLEAGDPDAEVDLAWQCYHQLRSIYHATTTEDRRIAEKVISSFLSCPIPEVARLGRTQGLAPTTACLLQHQRHLQRWHRSHQLDHREGPPACTRIQRFHPLQAPEYSWQPQATALTANDPAHAELRRPSDGSRHLSMVGCKWSIPGARLRRRTSQRTN